MGGNRPPKRLFLGMALRQARLAAGHTNMTKFAEKLGRTPAALSRWETGDRTPSPTDVAQILTALEINGEQYEEILALAHNVDAPLWIAVSLPEQRQHLNALLGFELGSTEITDVSPLLVTGLLQTEAYVRAIMTSGDVPRDDVENRIRIRLGRQRVLDSTKLTAVIGEAALQQHVGGREVLADQLEHLIRMANYSNVDLRVVPFTAGWVPSLEGGWTVIQSPEATMVHVENRRSGWFLHLDQDVATYKDATAAMLGAAMSPQDSAGLIAEKMKHLRR